MAVLYAGTTHGVYRIQPDTGEAAPLGPQGTSVESLAILGNVLVAARTPDYGLPMRRRLVPSDGGLVRSADGGQSWSALDACDPALHGRGRISALAAGSDRFLAGADPAEFLVGDVRAERWEPASSLRSLPGYASWGYPLPPHRPHVMFIAPHPAGDGLIYAGIEVGGVLRSMDGGQTWDVVGEASELHPDIHGLALSPADRRIVYAATPDGVFWSGDAGESWAPRSTGLVPRYCRPIAAHLTNPDVALVVATDGASGFFGVPAEQTGGSVFVTLNAGVSWTRVTDGLPAALGPTPSLAADPRMPGRFYLPTFGGEVYVTDEPDAGWRRLCADLPPVLRLVAA